MRSYAFRVAALRRGLGTSWSGPPAKPGRLCDCATGAGTAGATIGVGTTGASTGVGAVGARTGVETAEATTGDSTGVGAAGATTWVGTAEGTTGVGTTGATTGAGAVGATTGAKQAQGQQKRQLHAGNDTCVPTTTPQTSLSHPSYLLNPLPRALW